MDQSARRSLARCLAVLGTPLVVLGMMAGTASASSAWRLSDGSATRAPAAAAAPASLRAAIRTSLGAAVSAAGYSQQAELTASDAAPGNSFGGSVALSASGGTALVGAPVRHTGTGAAYVFTLRHGTWSRTAELTASDGALNDLFGQSVALSATGSTALVGAIGGHSGAGAAYVFALRHGTWSRTAELTASDGALNDLFASSVALSATGSTALVGAPGLHSDAGAADVFTLRRGTWSRTAELTGARSDVFGSSVALSASGSTALVGAPGRNTATGVAYVFTLRGGTWSRTGELTASDGANGDSFGNSVALSGLGSTALAGLDGRNPFTGAVYVFTLRHGTWSRTGELTATDVAPGDEFGDHLALSAAGSTALAAAPFRNAGGLYRAGAVYVFA